MPLKKIIAPKKVGKPVKLEEKEKEEEPEELKKKVEVPVVVPQPKGRKTPELLRGFRDVLADEQVYWEWLRRAAEDIAESYSFERIEFPILEKEELFVRTVGKQTDIVEKEIYSFEDKGGDKVALRPEMTASAARAYINHGMLNMSQPVKMFYFGPTFRYDRPQAGRYRQFNQVGFESIGSSEAVIDAQIIVMVYNFLKSMGLETTVRMNSIGTPETRRTYKVELASYYRTKRNQICDDCKRRLVKNPMRLLDCKMEQCQAVRANAPQILDWLDEESKNHFMRVLEFLDEAGTPYALDPYLVRGLDYYNRTVFEVWVTGDEGERSQNALGGGGRYDGLIELLGGREGTPACGVALGVERIILAMKELKIQPPAKKIDVFFAQLGDSARRVGLRVFEDFRQSGISVREAFGKGSLKAQLEIANKLNVPYTLILGQKEVLDGTIIVRDMESGAQEIVDAGKIVQIMRKKLEVVKTLDIPA
ncbi:MAG: histidine--tRNA ligase [Patescibacteria group bacterium]|jgi:histidyl-tRNA synthetase